MNFWRVCEILLKRKWLIGLSVLVAVGLTAGAARLAGSKWLSTVQLIVPQNSALLRSGATSASEENNPDVTTSETALKGQVSAFRAMIKSRSVLEPALRSVGLTEAPPGLLKNIDIDASSPRLFELTVIDLSQARSMAVANSIAQEFIDQYQQLNSNQVEQAINLLTGQLHDTDTKLAQARKSYDEYRRSHNIAISATNNIEMVLARLKENRQKRDDVSQKLAEARAQQLALEHEALPDSGSNGQQADSPEIAQLKMDVDGAVKKLTDLRILYTDAWPEVKAAIARRDELQRQLQFAQQKAHTVTPSSPQTALTNAALQTQTQNKLMEDIAGYTASLTFLDAAVSAAQRDLDLLKGIDTEMSSLTADISEKSEMHTNLVARLERAQSMLDVSRAEDPIAIMDKVGAFNPPVNASSGRTLKLTMLGALCALLLTSALVVSLDSIDRRLRTVTEAEIVLPARVVAAIPQPMGQVTYEVLSRAAELAPQSLHSEAYRFLGMDVLNQPANVRSLMMLSAKAEQGSTTALTNLAITLAQAGKRVIMVDANIRTPELHRAFSLPNAIGFTNLISDSSRVTLIAAIQHTSVANLSVITSGVQPANPWSLFRSPRLLDLSRELLVRADYVLYDTPSALMFTDALNLGPIIDGAYLCVRALQPLSGGETRVVEYAKSANVQLLGSILTDVPASVIEGYHNYQHYYAPSANGGNGSMPQLSDGENEHPATVSQGDQLADVIT